MKVELKDLREGPVDLDLDCLPAALDLEEPGFAFSSPVRGVVRFSLLPGDKVMALGRIETRVESSCVRCLRPIKLSVRAPVDVIYEQRKDDGLSHAEAEVFGVGEDGRGALFDGEAIHPEPQLREAMMLELPQLPVCSEKCRGLCPRCGANRNEDADGRCACEVEAREEGLGKDPDWKVALKKIHLD